MVKTEQVRQGCQGLEKLGRYVVDMHNPHNNFLIDYLSKNDSFDSEQDLAE